MVVPETTSAPPPGNGDLALESHAVAADTASRAYELRRPASPSAEPASAQTGMTLRALSRALTLEVAVYVVIGLCALGLRIVNLDARPLSPAEAETAASAWQFLSGTPAGAYPSPLLFTLDWIAFFLFGAFDLTARFLPAVLSASLVLIPALARRSLGRSGAVIAAALIAFSPTLVFFGRTLAGVDLAVGAAVAALICFYNYRARGADRSLYASAVLAALALTAESAAYTIMLAGGLYMGLAALWQRRAQPEPDTPTATDEGNFLARSYFRAALVFAVTYLLAATTFLINRDGLGVAFNLLGAWVSSWSAIGPLSQPLILLLLYEPLPLIFGLAGLALALTVSGQEGEGVGLLKLLAIVSSFAFLWYSLIGVKNPADVVAVALPLMLLSGWFIGNLFERAREDIAATGGWRSTFAGELPVLIILLVVAALTYLQVVSFLQQSHFSSALDALYQLLNGNSAQISIMAAVTTLLVVTLLLLGVFIGLSILLIGIARTTTLLALTVLLLLALGTLRTTWQLNFTQDEPLREPAAGVQTPLQIRDLVHDLEWYSQWRTGDPHVMEIAADPALGAVGRWYLRVFSNVTWGLEPAEVRDAQALVTPAETPPPGNWQGQRYHIAGEWQPGTLNGLDLWKWYVLRQGGETNWQATMMWLRALNQE